MTKKRRKRWMKKRTRNRLILLFGVLFSFILIFNIGKGIVGIFVSHREKVKIEDTKGYEVLKENGLNDNQIKEIVMLSNYRPDRAKRYAQWPVDNMEDRIMQVNCDMDLEPFEKTVVIQDDKDITMLVNKFNALPEGYVPPDLVPVEQYACVQGEDYSCQDVDQIELRKEAYDAYLDFCKAAQEKGIHIRAIAGYRSYAYQQGLWNYGASTQGETYADQYYARPGQSEHNSGLGVDITFNDYPFNEIEKYDGYDWICKNAHKFGFILRYPEDKVDVTRFQYESWHFRYVGKEAAKVIYEKGWTLEEYHGAK